MYNYTAQYVFKSNVFCVVCLPAFKQYCMQRNLVENEEWANVNKSEVISNQ